MTWPISKTTKHSCNEGNGPVFGRKTAGCSRCDELLAGAKPVVWNTRAKQDAATLPRNLCTLCWTQAFVWWLRPGLHVW